MPAGGSGRSRFSAGTPGATGGWARERWVGSGARTISSAAPASAAAGTARPTPTVTGPNPGSAARMAGNVMLKATTPSAPQPTAGIGTRPAAKALS